MMDEYILRLEKSVIAMAVFCTLLIIGLGVYVQGLSREAQERGVVVDGMVIEVRTMRARLLEECP